MTDIDRIEQRLAAVERTLTDGDHDLNDIADLTDLADDVEQVEQRLDSIEERVAELEGIFDALDGYVSNVRSVNEDVEQQAGAAYAAVDRLEDRVEDLERTVDGQPVTATPESNADSTEDAMVKSDAAEPASNRSDLERTVDDIVPEQNGEGDESDGWMSKLTGGLLSDDDEQDESSAEALEPANDSANGEPSALPNGSAATDEESDAEEEGGFLESMFK